MAADITYTIRFTCLILKRTTKITEDTIYNPFTKLSDCLHYFYDNQRGKLEMFITQRGSESLMRTTDI